MTYTPFVHVPHKKAKHMFVHHGSVFIASGYLSNVEVAQFGDNGHGEPNQEEYQDRNTFSKALFGANMARLQNLKHEYHETLTTKCYQLKIHRMTDNDFAKVVRKIYESEQFQPVQDRIELIGDQWRTLDLWEIGRHVNPRPTLKFDRVELFKHDFTLSVNEEDMTLRCSIVLCSIFEDLMQSLNWKAADTPLDIEEDICNVVGKLILNVKEQDRPSLLKCMQNAMVNIQAHGNESNDDKLQRLLITKKKYNGLNLACILLEQMILDNKDNNESWMQIVCTQFIDLVCQLIIEPDYREDVLWTLTHLSKLESKWKVADVYNLIKNGLLMFHSDQKEFHRYLMIIRNFALHPSLNIRASKDETQVDLRNIRHSQDESEWKCLNGVVCEQEPEKSVDQVLGELIEAEVRQTEKETIQQLITNLQTILSKYDDVHEYPIIIEHELDRIRKSEQKYCVDVLSSCLAVTSMAVHICK